VAKRLRLVQIEDKVESAEKQQGENELSSESGDESSFLDRSASGASDLLGNSNISVVSKGADIDGNDQPNCPTRDLSSSNL